MLLDLLCLSTDDDLRAALEEALQPFGDRIRLEFTPRDQPDLELLRRAYGVLSDRLAEETRGQMPNLRWLQLWSAGVDGKIYPALWDNDAVVTTGSGIHAASCAEHVLAMMLALARGLPACVDAQQRRDWQARSRISEAIFELEGKTVGIVGAGVIGQAIGRRCQAFGMRTVGTRRDVSQPTEGIDVLLSHLQYHDLILASDLIVLALPLTDSTRMLFGEDEIEILRKGTYFFNIGRGGLVDEKWLVTALQNRWIAGAGLDVFADEPLPTDSPFWSLDNVLITPHIGGVTPAYWTRFARLVAAQVQRLLQNEPLQNQVSRELGY